MATLFKEKHTKVKTITGTWDITKQQCPCCKTWFTCYVDNRGLLQHISIVAKSEAVGKLLGELKKTPHFDFWKNNTKKTNRYYIKRDWTI